MRAMVFGLLTALIACNDAGPSSRLTVELSADSAAFSVRDSLVLVATLRDAQGSEVQTDDVEWSSDTPALTVSSGVVKANSERKGGISARVGASVATTHVWAQPMAMFTRLGFSAARLSPGATFRASPATWDTINGTVAYRDYGSALAKQWGTLSSSNPAVADWVAYSPETLNPGWTVAAFTPGEAVLRIASGGLRDSLIVRVDDPVLVKLDSMWNGGSWNKCGLTASGEAWCSGSNTDAELGTRTGPWYHPPSTHYQQGSATPVGVDTDERFEKLASSSNTWCAISLAKRVLCWGRGDSYPLGGQAPTSDCYRSTYPGNAEQHQCSFVPLLVDRELDQVLHFDDLRSRDVRMCGHVAARGATLATVSPVDEYWCWGGSYGQRPQQRPGFFE